MKEDLLHFLWKYQYFNCKNLLTAQGLPVQVIDPGKHNSNAGPDFLDATLLIDGIRWLGNVEIHVNASDWFTHRHEEDPAYNSVILHVVWSNDRKARREDTTMVKTIELKGRVNRRMTRKYQDLTEALYYVPCSPFTESVGAQEYLRMAVKAYDERLRRKTDEIIERLKNNAGNWDLTVYQLIFRYFGMQVNCHPFEELSSRLSYRMLLRHRDRPFQLEALLFGMAGFLRRRPEDGYHESLQEEFAHLQHKYELGNPMSAHEWKFMRLRPANFPTVRLAQLVVYLASSDQLFNRIYRINTLQEGYKVFHHPVTAYWQQHYHFGKPRKHSAGAIGKAFHYSLMINVIVPLQEAYQRMLNLPSGSSNLLRELKPENNRIIRMWNTLQVCPDNAIESQGLIELFRQRCEVRRCLECSVGHRIMRTA